jgi:predicted nuclease with TOPRIM domain
MSKVYEAHLDEIAHNEALKDIHDHRDDQISDLKEKLKAAHAEIMRLEEENGKLQDRISVYAAHYDNGRV